MTSTKKQNSREEYSCDKEVHPESAQRRSGIRPDVVV